uniref:dnaJ homolog subfamily C member 3-like n=1 Tax=Styela clava TaxID=7725 RepID=UPI00193A75CD|nr:dnaJ homolog subfamily C member 3-like [Styela clava]
MMKEKLLKYVHSLASQMPILLVLLDLHFEGVEGVNKAEGNKHLTLGNQLLHAGQLADALTQYHSSIDNDPNNYQAYYMRATVYLAMGRSRTALPDLDQVISLQPNFIKARLQRGNLYLKMGRFNDAQIDYEAVLSQEDNADAKAKVEVIRPLRRNINQAAQSFQSKDYRQVVNYMKEVIETCPWNAEFRETRAMAHEGLGDLRSAISDLKPTTTLRLDNTAGYLKISILYYRLGDIEQSLDEIRECLKLDPDHKECYAHYKNVKKLFKTVESGRKFMNEERWDDAIGKFTKALQQEPRIPAFNLEIKLRICESYVKKASPIEALAACKDVLKYDSHNIPAIFLISEAYTLNSQYQEAVDILQEASQIDENYPGLNDKIKQAQKLLKQSQKRDYYKILGVSRNARKREIEKAYRNLARQWHPDNFKTEEEKKSAESKFIDLAAAKEVLTDPEKRRKFDSGVDPLDPEEQNGGGHHGHGFHFNPFGGGGFKFHFGGNPFHDHEEF